MYAIDLLKATLEPNASSRDVMKVSGLDWSVEKRPLYYVQDSVNVLVENNQALVRTSDNSVLSIVSNEWIPTQNEEAFDFFREFVQAGQMTLHTAGSLKGGTIVWALAKIREPIDLFGGDIIEPYLLFTNPHEYGKSIDIRFTPKRIVCSNQITMTLSNRNNLGIKSTHRTKFNPALVKQTLSIAHRKLLQYQGTAEFLGSRRYARDDAVDYYTQILTPAPTEIPEEVTTNPIVKKMMNLLDEQPGMQYAPGTWWQVWNALTYGMDHVFGRSDENRLHSSWYGVNKTRKIKGLELAMTFAERSDRA